MKKRIEFLVRNQKIIGDLHLPENLGSKVPCVVTSHGYKSNRNSEKYLEISHQFPLEGIAVLRFDHRGALNGESDGEFEDTTLTKRVEDLKRAIDYLAGVKEIDSQRIGLFGSSLGGVTILTLPKDERIKAIVLLATPVSFPRLEMEARESSEKLGYYQYPDGTRIKKELYEDIEKYDFKEVARKTNCPTLIIHGYLDELVPHREAKILFEAIGSKIKKLKFIEGGNHTFTDLEKLSEVISLSLDWFKKYLK